MAPTSLDLTLDAAALTAALVDLPSESGDERALADAIEAALRPLPHLTVDRYGNNVVARTRLGHAERVLLAGHIDTVPIAENVPSRLDEDGVLWGCGTCDMKSGVAVQLRIAATVPEPNRDLTFVFYDNEEVAADLNGLGHVADAHPDWLEGDFAVLLEPSDGQVEGGCQGTLRVLLRTTGERAHSARSWMGANAIHAAAPILDRLAAYQPRYPLIDGLEYREGLNAVGIEGGVAGNVIPDACTVTVNFRYCPRPHPRGGPGPRQGGLRRLRRDRVRGRRPQRRRPARPLPPGRRRLRRGRRRHPDAQVRLDRRGPLQRARRPRRQLRPGQSAPRPPARRAGRHRQDPGRREAPGGLADRLSRALTPGRPFTASGRPCPLPPAVTALRLG
ncbi:succinyldiaminopimelate desuccinylase [Streptomyces sp. IgraMP-1]|nr:succinyldiaminopimelate desuccinylase [Streptomyces sp. IgraMP-1]